MRDYYTCRDLNLYDGLLSIKQIYLVLRFCYNYGNIETELGFLKLTEGVTVIDKVGNY